MSDSKGKGSGSTLVPPQWIGHVGQRIVLALNERSIRMLCALARSASELKLPALQSNRGLWAQLDEEGIKRMAQLPFVLVDIRFKDLSWWQGALEMPDSSGPAEANGLPLRESGELMNETLMAAWRAAVSDQLAAHFDFSMAPGVAEYIAALTPEQIRVIAASHASAIQVRWGDDFSLWREYLQAVIDAEPKKLALVRGRICLRLNGEILVQAGKISRKRER